MRLILRPVWVAVVGALVCTAQPPAEAVARWRASMRLAEKADDALPALREARRIAETFGESDPRLFETVVRLAQECGFDCSREEQAGYVDRALNMRAKVRPLDGHYAGLLMDLGHVAVEEDRYRDALMVYGEALEIREHALGTTHQKIAETYLAMAWVYQEQEDPAQARTTMQHALEIREQAGARGTAGYADLVRESADLFRAAKDAAKAKEEYGRAIALYERLWKPADARFIAALLEIAHQNEWGDGKDLAEKMFRRVAEIQKQARPYQKEHYAALREWANFLYDKGRAAEAEAVYLDAFTVRQRIAKNDAEAASCMRWIAQCRLDQGLYREAAEAGELSLGMDDSALATYGLLTEAHLRLRNESKSEEYLRMLLGRAGKTGRGQLIDAAETASAIYQERGNYPRAAEKLELAIATREAVNAKDSELPAQMFQLARLYQTMGRPEDANRVNWQAMKLSMQSAGGEGAVIGGLLVVFVAAPLVVATVSGFLYRYLARRVDKKLDGLFIEPDPGPEAGLAEPVQAWTTGPENAAAAVAPALAPAATERVAVRAEGTVLFSIRVLNLLLSLLTLGIYSFWGKAKVRRFVCGQSEFLGDRFAFHGTGRELSLGWLRALPALAFVFLLPQVLPAVWPGRYAVWMGPLLGIVAFSLLWPIARVGAYRYRMNRMSWRGIRFSYRGAALRFLAASVAGGILTIVTLGIYAPFLQVRLRRLLFDPTYFGDREFRFSGRGKDLLPAWIFALPLIVCTFGIGWAWWSVLRHRYYWAHTTFSGARFRCTATGRKLLGLWIGNAAILVFTIGLGSSWVTLRTLQFWTRHIELVGVPELTAIRQDARAASASGESFADFLGFDFGF